MVDRDRRYTFANDTYAEILGLASPDIVGRAIADVLAPLYEDQIRPHLDRAMMGERVTYELTRPTSGGLHHYTVRYEPTKIRGEVTVVVVVITDITERKLAEEFMKASEARYRTLFEYAPDGILIVHPDSHYIDANAAVCRMLGYEHAELVKLSARDIVVAAEIPEIAPALTAIAAKSHHHREWGIRRKDGSNFAADVIATAMPDGNVLAMLRDITERKQSDERIREQLAELLRWQEIMLGREDRVQALKTEVNELLARLQEPPRYSRAENASS
jgi:PAS domain S-box-containing protein